MYKNYPEPTIFQNSELQKQKQRKFHDRKSSFFNLKKHGFFGCFLLLLFVLISSNSIYSQTFTDNSPNGNETWTVPCGVTSVTVEIWGGGGSGGGSTAQFNGGSGAGGGGYSSKTFNVTAGEIINYNIGAGGTATVVASGNSGGNSTLTHTNSSSFLTANGGAGGLLNTGAGGSGGSATGGTTNTSGQNGANGGGSSGGNGGNGGNAPNTGGNGNNSANGSPGTVPGGGGGGGEYYALFSDNNRSGGGGANGQVIITPIQIYCVPSFNSGVEPITNVTFAGINNNTPRTLGGSSLETFCIYGSVIQGSTNAISVKGNTDGNYTDYIKIYIDWDQDGFFGNNANEFTDIGTITNSNGIDAKSATGDIVVPSGAILGQTTMRVVKVYYNSNNPCFSGNNYGQAEDYPITVTSPISITSISPTTGCAGSTITINGTNLSGADAANVKIGGTAVTSITSNTATQIVAVVGTGTTGKVAVTISGNTATSASTFTVTNKPSLSNISSPAALCAGGTINPTVPTITNNGSTITSQSWQIETAVSSGSYSNITMPYNVAFADNGKKIRYTATNGCGTSNGNTVAITINDKPSLSNISSPAALCAGATINPTVPTITSNGATIISQSWQIETVVSSGSYSNITMPYAVAFADNGKKIRYTVTNGCGSTNGNAVALTVNNIPTLSLSSAGATTSQSICINTGLTPITYTIGGSATTASLSGTLPAGVNGSFSSGVFTISGTPTEAGTFNYAVTTSGGLCAAVALGGTITVKPLSTMSLTSAVNTNIQTTCRNTAITSIKYTIGGSATGVTLSGTLPAGLNGVLSGKVYTISGTPTNTGTFNYTVTTTGGCLPAVALGGTITVNEIPSIALSSGASTTSQNICINTGLTPISYTIGGSGTGATVTGLPAGINGNFSSGVFTISGTPTVDGTFNYTVTTTGGNCTAVALGGTITVRTLSTMSLTSAVGTNIQTTCRNTAITNISYTIGGTATGVTLSGTLPAGVTGTLASGVYTISGTPSTAGTFNYTVTTTGGCLPNIALAGTITVNEIPSITLSSIAATTTQNICMNTGLTPITYTIGGSGTGATVTGLPTGVTGNFSAGVFTISGTPTVAGTFNYTVTTTGGNCTAVALGGTIIVKPLSSTISLTSGAGTNNQNICKNSALINIIYGIGGSATGATVTGLPAGINGNFASGVFTISGSPSVSGTFNYTVSTTGGCSTGVNASGTIKIEPLPVITLTSSIATTNQNICINTSFDAITYNIGGSATGANVSGLPSGISGSYAGGTFTISGTPTASGTFNYIVTSSGSSPCSEVTSTGTIQVDALATVTLSSLPATNNQTICINNSLTNITYTLGGGASGATVSGLPTGITANVNGAGTLLTISGTPTVSGTFTYTVITTGGTCTSVTTAGTITVVTLPVITLTSGASTTNQNICINTSITAITYSVGGSATGATVSGLPTGVTGNFTGGVFTISGTASAAGTFNYTVTSSGSSPCANVISTGTIKVDALPVINRTSLPATTNQTICINNALSNITYSLSGSATGATVSGLPTGVTGNVNGAGTVLTISGTPTVSGTFNYTVTTTGGTCTSATTIGTIKVEPIPVITLTSAVGTDTQTVCINTGLTPITYSIGGSATGATVSGLPTGITANYSAGILTISGTPTTAGAILTYTITTSGGTCTNVTKTGTIKVDALPTITRSSLPATTSQTLCMGNALTNITYTLAGSATGATVSGLPTGVTGTTSGTVFTISGSPTVSGNFTYTVTTTGSACTGATTTGTINVNPLPNIEISSDYCTVPGKVKLVATSNIVGTTFIWSTGATGSTIEIDIVGMYTVTGTTPAAAGGCSSTSSINVANELVTDGSFTNFNAASPSFYTEYTQNQPFYNGATNSGLYPEGYYAVNTSAYGTATGTPLGYHPSFHGRDHTNNSVGARNFLMVNGSASLITPPSGPPRQRVIWQQTVNVAPGTSYYFSAWGMNLNPGSPARLQFEVNGALVGSVADLNIAPKPTTEADVNLANWVRFYSTSLWNSGTATTAVIRIVNLNTDPGGNDFGLDDISFGTLLPFIKLTSASGTDAQTACQNYNITPISYAVGGGIAGPTVTGLPAGITQVYVNGVLTLSGAPTVTGTFNYTVSTTGTCSTVTVNGTIIVKPTPVQPTLSTATQPTCASANGSFTITNYNSGYTYAITPSTGVSRTGDTVTAPAGNYTVTATLNGCTSVASAGTTVNAQPVTPAQPVLSTVTQPTCTTASGSFTITNYDGSYTYAITPSTGVSRTGNTVTAPAGNYTITATLGACTSTASANRIVNAQPATPVQPTLGSVTQPTCASAFGSFTITNHSGSYTYTATPSAGVTFSGATVTAPAGNYTIIATLGSCNSIASSSITVNAQPTTPAQPILSVVTQPTCTTATGSFTITNYNALYTYAVTPSTGVTRSGATITAPAGTYTLTATLGACTSVASISRTVNAQPATPVQPTLGTVTQPTCTTATGSFTITNYNASYTYSAIPSGGVTFSGATVTAGVGNYTIRATSGACASVVSASVSVISQFKTWNGNVSTDWNDVANWTPAGIPTAIQSVSIPSGRPNYPVISSAALSCSLTIQTGADLTVIANNSITVTNDVNILTGSEFILEDSASLIQVNNVSNTVTGIFSMTRITQPMYRYDYTYWGSPLTLSSNYTLGDLTPLTRADKYYSWIPSVGGVSGNWRQESVATVMNPLMGYIARAPDTYSTNPSTKLPYTAVFTGTPNNGNISVPVSCGTMGTGTQDDKWNLLGNPYPSAINILAFLGENQNIEGNVSFWTHDSPISASNPNPFYGSFTYNYSDSDMLIVNGSGSVPGGSEGNIASGQGFMISMLSDCDGTTSSVNFNNSMRSSTFGNANFYKTANVTNQKNRVWLSLVDKNKAATSAMVGYIEGATNGKDRLFDALSDIGSTMKIYSILDNIALTIQGRTLPFDANEMIPLGVKIVAPGNYSIAIDQLDGLFDTQAIYLEDKLMNVIHDIKLKQYDFVSDSGTFNDRFILRYNTNLLSVNNPSLSTTSVIALINKDKINIQASENIKKVQVFDVAGKLIKTYSPKNSSKTFVDEFLFSDGVYFAKIKLENGTTESRKLASGEY